MKVKGVISGEKKHIRFADWGSFDVSAQAPHIYLESPFPH